MSYKKLYSECGYSQNALTSDKHFLSPNNPNYYLKKYYETNLEYSSTSSSFST